MSRAISPKENKKTVQIYINESDQTLIKEFVTLLKADNFKNMSFSKMAVFSTYIIKDVYDSIPKLQRLKIKDIYTLQRVIREKMGLPERKPYMSRKDKKTVQIYITEDIQINVKNFILTLKEQKIKSVSFSVITIFGSFAVQEVFESLTEIEKAEIQHFYEFQYAIREKLGLSTEGDFL